MQEEQFILEKRSAIQPAEIEIGNLHMEKPIIQGGMGIGASRSHLAGAVAFQDGMGVISTAQTGYDDPMFRERPETANLQVLPLEIRKAKYIAGNPISLPEYVKESDVKIAPIVSNKKAADITLRMWDNKYHRTADVIAMKECDAGNTYKQAFVQAQEEDVVMIDSPAGMPGRALRTPFVEKMMKDMEELLL